MALANRAQRERFGAHRRATPCTRRSQVPGAQNPPGWRILSVVSRTRSRDPARHDGYRHTASLTRCLQMLTTRHRPPPKAEEPKGLRPPDTRSQLEQLAMERVTRIIRISSDELIGTLPGVQQPRLKAFKLLTTLMNRSIYLGNFYQAAKLSFP